MMVIDLLLAGACILAAIGCVLLMFEIRRLDREHREKMERFKQRHDAKNQESEIWRK